MKIRNGKKVKFTMATQEIKTKRTGEEVRVDLSLAVLAFLRHAEDLGQRAACVKGL